MRYNVTCTECSKGFQISHSSYSERIRGLTSGKCRSCVNRNRKYPGMRKAWKGLTPSTENELQRNRFYRDVRPVVLARDNNVCQVCSISYEPESLHVDHIESWRANPELRFVESNCRTLCMACHYYVTFKRKLPLGQVWCSYKLKLDRIED